jgi:hypothetical protein
MCLCQLLAKHDILSAPLVVSPGLEDLESLELTGTSAALVSIQSSAVCSARQGCSRHRPRGLLAVLVLTSLVFVMLQVGWLDIKDIIEAFLSCEQ